MAMLLDIGWLSVLIAFLTEGKNAHLVVTPLNIAVIKGTEIAMECRSNATTNRTLQWRIKQDQTSDDQTLFDGSELVGPFAELYKLRKNGSKTLTLVMKATEETAKRYICEVIGFPSASAELVVLASEPVCSLINVTAADEYFQATMHCVVRYSGNWIPTMNWTQSSEVSTENSGNSARITESVTTITGNGVSKSLLVIEGKRGEMLIVYNCTTWFDLYKKPIQTTAVNIPDYVHTWSSPALTLNTGKHAASFVPLLTIAVALTVALTVTSICLLILKRKLKDSGIETDNKQIRAAEFTDIYGQTYESIDVVTESIGGPKHSLEPNARDQIFDRHEYMVLSENDTSATCNPSGDISHLEKAVEINDSQHRIGKSYEYADLPRETAESSQNPLVLTRHSGSNTHDYLELTENTASHETSLKQKAHDEKSVRGINLDFLVPVLDNSNY